MRLAFVVPRYGRDILGGAESATRSFAEHLVAAGFDATVLTTCAHDIDGERTPYPAGISTVNGVTVIRFPVADSPAGTATHQALTRQISQGGPVSSEQEHAWVDSGFHSPGLYEHILTHGPAYDLLIFVPYPFSITYYGTALWPERSVVWPCLHDEPFARFAETRRMLLACRGVMYNCEPEMSFATQTLRVRHPRSAVVGIGVDDARGDAVAFREQTGITEPFVLYTGRLDPMKNLLELFSFFIRHKQHSPGHLKLVIIGQGPLAVPKHPDIIELGFVDEGLKRDACAAALLLCQPSLVESFSLVLMESWFSATPVLVNGNCDVTRYHVLQSQGGLYYLDYPEFSGTLDWYLEHPAERKLMGLGGRDYVRRTYDWEMVIDRFRSALSVWR